MSHPTFLTFVILAIFKSDISNFDIPWPDPKLDPSLILSSSLSRKENLLKFENDEQFLSIINENYNLSLEECIDFYMSNNGPNYIDLIILNEDVKKLKIILDILKEVDINNFSKEIS